MTYISSKTFCHSVGLSACFRQHNAESHCRFLHGYALEVRMEFEATELDKRNWVVDFGGLKPLKAWLEKNFDHKLLVAHDDPQRPILAGLVKYELADMVIVPATGCEAFAEYIYNYADDWLAKEGYFPRVRMRSVEVREHGANSAIFTREL